jgi:Tol biopolymer transport system component
MRVRLLLITLALVPAVLLPQGAWAAVNAATNGRIVFARDMGAGNHDIFVANADGSGAVDITNNAFDDVDPSVSPDGTRVLFSSNRGGSYDIYVMNLNASGPALRLTASFLDERYPSWSSDANHIVFSEVDPANSVSGFDIYSANADGTNAVDFYSATTIGDDIEPVQSPDGTLIVWSHVNSVNGRYELWEMTAGGQFSAQLVGSSTTDTYPTWSPDSTRLAWNCSHAICVWGADGYTVGAATGPIAGLGRIAWSPDGRYLLYNDNAGLKRVNVDGSGETTVTSTAGDSQPEWVPGALANVRIPVISGLWTIGYTLVADAGIWAGSGPIAYTYQWERCNPVGGNGCTPINGATGQHYTTTTTDLNATLRVFVTATSSSGAVTAASAITPTIENPVSVGLPDIVGTLTVGSTAVATTGGLGDGLGTAPVSYAFVWERCDTLGNTCSPIVGAVGPSYVITLLDSGHTLRVVVTATNTNGSVSGTSLATAVIGGLAPVNRTIPVIAGTPVLGATLVATSGVWTGGGGLTYSYQWKRCDPSGTTCQSIPAAAGTAYTVVADDAGSTLLVTVTATSSYGIVGADSLATVIVGATPTIPGPGMPASTVAPRAVGTPAVGSTLTATTGGFVGAGNSYAFQWQRCDTQGLDCESISGATMGSYLLKQADLGSTIRVVVTARNSAGSASAYSDVTSVVAAAAAGSSSGSTQSAKALVLYGTARADRLVAAKGRTRIIAGAGNDTIYAADGRRETIDCGSGRDTAYADRTDVLVHCERVVHSKKRLAAKRR